LYIASGEIPVAGYGREESRSRRESIREMPPARRTAVKASYSKYWPTIFHLLSRRRLRKLRAEAAKRNCRSLVEIFRRGKVKGRVSGRAFGNVSEAFPRSTLATRDATGNSIKRVVAIGCYIIIGSSRHQPRLGQQRERMQML